MHSVTKNCCDLSLFKQIALVISIILQIPGLQPKISKVFLDHQNIVFSQQVRTILVTKHHFQSQYINCNFWTIFFTKSAIVTNLTHEPRNDQVLLASGPSLLMASTHFLMPKLQQEEERPALCNFSSNLRTKSLFISPAVAMIISATDNMYISEAQVCFELCNPSKWGSWHPPIF